MRMLKENGSSIPVTDENKEEYVKLVCQMKMTGSSSLWFSLLLFISADMHFKIIGGTCEIIQANKVNSKQFTVIWCISVIFL